MLSGCRVRVGHRPGEVAKQLGISRQTVCKWVRRWRTEGEAGLLDRSSRPHRSPRTTSPETTAAIVAARVEHHARPVRLAAILGIAASAIGLDYVHVAIDDHTRLAYAEVLPDERTATCAGFLARAAVWFTGHGVTVERVLTDNAPQGLPASA